MVDNPNPGNPTSMGSTDSLALRVKELVIVEPDGDSALIASNSAEVPSCPSSATASASSSPLTEATSIPENEELDIERAALNIPDPLFIIKDAGRKGLGVFATVDIPRGTTIMMEEPVMHFAADYTPQEIINAYDNLSTETQIEFMSLASVHCTKISSAIKSQLTPYTSSKLASYPANFQRDINMLQVRSSGKKTPLSVFYANAMGIGDGAAIFKQASRINHSCVPNASYHWAPHNQVMQIRVTKDVDAGSEITICYIDPCNPTNIRKNMLFTSYGFKCDCPACGPSWDPNSFAAQSVDRRWKLHAFGARDYTWECGVSGIGKEEADMLGVISAFREEGLCIPQLGMACTRLGEIYMSAHYNKVEKAIRQFEEAVEEFMICLGPDFDQTKAAEKKLDETKKMISRIPLEKK
jgi:SET domain